jgi:hypothetical protein
MSEWREEKAEAAPLNWNDLRMKALIGAGCAGVVIAWMVFARPGEDAPSSSGFNLGAAGGSRGAATGRPFETRPKTSLDMVSSQIGDGPAGVQAGIYAGSVTQGEALASARSGGPAAAAAPAPPAAAAPAPPAPVSAADDAKNLAAAGVPTDAKSMNRLGGEPGMLSSLAGKLLDHPNILRAIMNNKTVVDAFMSRSRVKENCQNAGALKSYLSDPNSQGMKNVFPLIQAGLSDSSRSASLVGALADTAMVKAITACPSLNALSNDTGAIVSIAMGNPKALGLVTDPRGMAALASNPAAAGALAGLQSKLGGGK